MRQVAEVPVTLQGVQPDVGRGFDEVPAEAGRDEPVRRALEGFDGGFDARQAEAPGFVEGLDIVGRTPGALPEGFLEITREQSLVFGVAEDGLIGGPEAGREQPGKKPGLVADDEPKEGVGPLKQRQGEPSREAPVNRTEAPASRDCSGSAATGMTQARATTPRSRSGRVCAVAMRVGPPPETPTARNWPIPR